MNRLKSILLGGLLASVSIVALSQNANASEVNFHHDHLNSNTVAFNNAHQLRERQAREQHARQLRERQAREQHGRQLRERQAREQHGRQLRERQARLHN